MTIVPRPSSGSSRGSVAPGPCLRLTLAAGLGLIAAGADAQPFNVRTWYAQGQVFVVW
jgi:hypothetical protein